VVIPGDSKNSLLVKRLLGTGDLPRMPLGGDALPAEKIELIRAWIDQSASAAPKSSEGQGVTQPVAAGSQASRESPLFATKVRPILAGRCYPCHGPETQQHGLRLDTLQGILKGSDTRKIVIPGDSKDSALVARLLGQELPRMPYGAPPLSDDQVSIIRQWIDVGAAGADSASPLPAFRPTLHWAFVEPVRPTIPRVKNSAWCRNPIDNFVLARLEKEGLQLSPEAGKEMLVRRVSLDLTGLPPTLEEINAFLADKSPNAYEKVVDRLLASPHYGERMATEWLDLARYADTQGYFIDNGRDMWAWRDWVIDAYNRNMPFDQFTIDQLAGDLLPHATAEQLVASGFNRNHMINAEAGSIPNEFHVEYVIDRVSTTATTWLGTTLACAQCHNHKYDPFTQKDFYRFFAFFNNLSEKGLDGYVPNQLFCEFGPSNHVGVDAIEHAQVGCRIINAFIPFVRRGKGFLMGLLQMHQALRESEPAPRWSRLA
jgi:hypothetical protein